MKSCASVICGLWLVVNAALASEVSFTAKPSATKDGDKVRVAFAVSAMTDVEVSVLDANGKVVRHLAAGVLGAKNSPPEPLKPGLAQALEWNGLDDAGKKAEGGPFKVRVAAGLKGEFDSFLLYNPAASGPVQALAVGPNGTVYLFHNDGVALFQNWPGRKIKVISREGKHVRAVMPFPADIAPEKVKVLGPFQSPDGDLVPQVHNDMHLSTYPDPGTDMPFFFTPAVDSKGRVYWPVRGPCVAALDADGGVPNNVFVGARLLPDVPNLCMAQQYQYKQQPVCLAVSSDDNYVYLAGMGTAPKEQNAKKEGAQPLPCVVRIDAATRGKGEIFIGKLGKPGEEKELLTAPRGLAAAKGLLYVADPGADRVAVFKESNGSFAGEIKVKNPQTIGVDPNTGAVYVCVHTGEGTADLVKIENLQSGKELYRATLPKTNQRPNPGTHRISVDASAKPVLIWMPGLGGHGGKISCVEDSGKDLVVKGDPRDQTEWAEGPRDLTIDRMTGEVYVKSEPPTKWFRIDDATGKVVDAVILKGDGGGKGGKGDSITGPGSGTQLVVSPDGSLISYSWTLGLMRHDRTGKAINWPGQDKSLIPYRALMSFQQRDLAVIRPDEIFVMLPGNLKFEGREMVKESNKDVKISRVDVLGPDGAVKRTAIWACTQGAILRVDTKGNIYLAEPIKPVGRWYPEFFDGKLDPPKNGGAASGPQFWNSWMYGSIIKFPPSGGAIWYRNDHKPAPALEGRQPPADLLAKPTMRMAAQFAYQTQVPAEIQGAEWVRFGFSPHSFRASGSDTCMCESGGFDVDGFGRVFYPNLNQYRVEVVDGSNNFIATFGKYGNQDSGPDGTVKKPEIPLAWAETCVASDNYVYIADTVNRRVVRVKLGHAVEETYVLP